MNTFYNTLALAQSEVNDEGLQVTQGTLITILVILLIIAVALWIWRGRR